MVWCISSGKRRSMANFFLPLDGCILLVANSFCSFSLTRFEYSWNEAANAYVNSLARALYCTGQGKILEIQAKLFYLLVNRPMQSKYLPAITDKCMHFKWIWVLNIVIFLHHNHCKYSCVQQILYTIRNRLYIKSQILRCAQWWHFCFDTNAIQRYS